MLTAYSVYLALSNEDYEVSAASIEKNSDCGRLNLLCACCHERVYWNNRKGVKFFSHFPNSESSSNCERYTNLKSREQKKKSFISALNKEKADYEKYFWQLMTECYPIFDRYANQISEVAKLPECIKVFDKIYYPELKKNKFMLLQLINQVYGSSIEVDESVTESPSDFKIYKKIIKHSTKQYREAIASLLLDFLLQKRSQPIVYKLYILSVLSMFEHWQGQIQNPSKATNFAINQLFNLIVWLPWEEAINDLKCYGKVLPKHRYSKDFGGFLMNVVAHKNGEKLKCSLTLD